MRLSRAGALLGLLAFGLQARPGNAQEPAAAPEAAREQSKIKPVAERKLSEAERPTVAKKKESQARARRAERVKLRIPDRLRRALEQKIDARIAYDVKEAKRLRAEAIVLLGKFITESPADGAEMPEALLRIGELEWEAARDEFLLAFNRWEATPLEQRGAPPAPDYSRPRKRFLRVLQSYKTYRDYDLALYVDGFLAQEEGKLEESIDRFNRILAWFPKSRFVPDAHMVRGEYEFTKEFPNYEVAYQEYEQVLRFKESGLYDIALFKSAWCLWRLGKTDEAARRFLTVFKKTYEVEEKGGASDDVDELQKEALRNLVAVFVEDERHSASDMHQFLVKAGGEKFAGKIVRALAEAFYDQAHYERGVEAYRLLLKLEPTAPEGYDWALAVALGHSTMENWAELEKDYRWLIADFTRPVDAKGKPKKGGGAWVKVQREPTLEASEAALEKQLRADATGLHAKAQRDKTSRAEFEAASKLYAVYLSRFGHRTRAYEVHFNHAEINFYHLDDGATAADSYLAAVRLHPKGPLSRDALYNALAALEAARAREFESAKAAGQKAQETATDKKLTEAMELYVSSYPNDPDVPELLFRQGKLYYDYEVFDPAVRQWGLLVEKYPQSKFAAGAGELILDSFNKSKDYDNIETWARRLKTAPSFQTADQQKRLDTLIIGAVFKQGEQHGEKGNHALAAAAYLRAAREFPKEARAAQAAVNAEVEAKRAADLETLDAAVKLLIADHKQRPEAAQGVWIAATTYQSVGLFSQAADYHAVLASTWPKDEHHKDAAFNAVLLRTTVGEHEKAIASGNDFKKRYPRDEAADEVTFLMGKAHEKAGKWKDAERLYGTYSHTAKTASSRVESLVRLATVRVELGDEKGVGTALAGAVKEGKQNKGRLDDDGKYFAAKARYMQGERVLAEYEGVKIEGDVDQLKSRLKKKSELLKKAADAFLETAEMGVAEWTTAALYQIGFTYESFAQALINSPPPDSLSAEQKTLYSQQIDEFVVPIEERSIEAYESGWLKAVELGIFNSWTAKMRTALGRLSPELYAPMNETGFALRSRGPSPLPPLIDGPRRSKDGRSTPYFIPLPNQEQPAVASSTPAPPAKDADAKAKGDGATPEGSSAPKGDAAPKTEAEAKEAAQKSKPRPAKGGGR